MTYKLSICNYFLLILIRALYLTILKDIQRDAIVQLNTSIGMLTLTMKTIVTCRRSVYPA